MIHFSCSEPIKMTTHVLFEPGSPIIISGPTGSGKTVFTNKLLKDDIFSEQVEHILYCYGVYQPFFSEMKKDQTLKITFHQGLPSFETVENLNNGKFNIIVLDDLMEYIIKSEDVQSLFTKYCHHFNITVIFLTQNLFAQGSAARTITLNAHYLVLFANKRDESQILYLGRQLYPGQVKYFLSCYQDATSKQFGYLLVDCHPKSSKLLKLRTQIFLNDETIVYVTPSLIKNKFSFT